MNGSLKSVIYAQFPENPFQFGGNWKGLEEWKGAVCALYYGVAVRRSAKAQTVFGHAVGEVLQVGLKVRTISCIGAEFCAAKL